MNEIRSNLKSIAELKADNLQNWRMERIGDGSVLGKSPIIVRALENISKGSLTQNGKNELIDVFTIFKNAYHYTAIKLIDINGNLIVSDSLDLPTSKSVKELLPDAAKNREIMLTGLHKNEGGNAYTGTNLDVIVPLVSPDGGDVRFALILEVSPSTFIFPLIQNWTSDSETAETLIIRDDGNGNALFLNDLRHVKDASLNLVIPNENENVLAIMALKGRTGFAEGLDYRNEEVIGYILPVKDTKWFMIAKIDEKEAFSEIRRITVWFFGILALLIIIFIYVVSYSVKNLRMEHYRKLYELETEKKQLLDNYRYLIKKANDAIIISGEGGNIIEVNSRASELYGFSEDEMAGLNVRDLYHQAFEGELEQFVAQIQKDNGHIVELFGKKKDGSVFPLEISTRLVDIEGKPFYQSIIRDITERKRIEDALKTSEERFSQAFMNSPAFNVLVDLDDFSIIECNDAFSNVYGFSREEAIGKSITELGIYSDDAYRKIVSNVRGKRSVKNDEQEITTKTGKKKIILASREIIIIGGKEYLYVIGVDITETRKAQDAIRESEDKFKYVFESANVGKSITYLTGEIHVNRAFCKMLGYQEGELENRRWQEITPEEDITPTEVYIKKLLSGEEKSVRFTKRYIHKNGSHIWGDVSAVVRCDDNNKPMYFVVTINDITEKVIAEEALKQSEERFSIAFNNNPAWLAIVDLETQKMVEVNDAWCETFGHRREEALNKTPVELGIYTDEVFGKIIDNLRREGKIKNDESVVTTKEGDIRTLLVSREIIHIKDKPFLLAMGLDITERKRAEEELKKSELLFRTTLYSIGDGVITTDNTGRVQRMNEIAEGLTGWKESEAVGRKLDEVFRIINEDTQLKVDDPVAKVLKDGLIVGLANHTLLISKDGRETPIADSGAPIKNEAGEIIGVVLVFRDQTVERAREDILRKSEEKFRLFFMNALEGIAIHNLIYDDGKAVSYKIVDVNPKYTEILGLSREDALSKNVNELYNTKEPPFLNLYADVAETGIPKSFDSFVASLGRHFVISVFPLQKGSFATVFSDITEQKKATDLIKLSEERYRRISSTISDVAYSCLLSPSGVFELDWMTGGAEQLTGYTIEEIEERKCWRFLVIDEDRELFVKNVIDLKAGESSSAEFRIQRKNGEILWIQSYTECIPESDGSRRIYGGILDISDRKIAEEAVKETEQMFSKAFRNSPNAMLITSAEDGKIVDANDVFLQDTGFTRDEVIGRTTKDLKLFYFRNERDEIIKEVKEKGSVQNKSMLFVTKHGKNVDGLLSASLINLRGKPYFLSTIVNLTEIKKAADLLKKSEEKFRRLHESITDAVVMTDMEGRVVGCNNSYSEMLGYSEEELKNMNYIDLTPEKWHDMEKRIIDNSITSGGKSEVYQKEYIRKDGTVFPIELRTYIIRDDDGNPSGMWGVIRDITQRKQTEEALIKAKEKAEEMNKLKSNFLANMSHELRTPMTGILGFSEILAEELRDENERQMAQVIHTGGKRLMNTLNLILNLSKLESESVTVNPEIVNLSELSATTLKMFEVLAKNKDLELIFEADEDVYSELDEQFTIQVLSNLVQNAITYTNSGFVKVHVGSEKVGMEEFAVLKVSDTGIGIRKENQQVIFEPFRQVSEGFSRTYEGTGLGLTITKKYVELMNGTISVSSELGEGTVFTVKFPRCLNAGETVYDSDVISKDEIPALNVTDNKEILVVEDDENSARAVTLALEKIARVSVVESGEEALKLAANNRYNLVIMDIGLPGISGIDTVREIKKMKGYRNTPIVAVTAYAMAGDRETFLSEGCTHYVSKPFSINEFRELISGILIQDN
ncbi:MAG: PAS domain S-box protein [Ignavibacteria bacterium]